MFSNIVKDSFKSCDVLRRSGKIQLGSYGKRIFVPGGLRKKYFARCQILRSKYYLYTVYQKVFFNIVKDSFKSCDVLRRSGNVQLRSNGKIIFCSRWSEKKYLARCQISRSKYYLYTVYQKVFFNIVKDSFKSCDVLRRRGKIQLGSYGKKKFCSRWSEKKVLSTMSDFALKILSLYSLTKSVFQYSEGLIQIM